MALGTQAEGTLPIPLDIYWTQKTEDRIETIEIGIGIGIEIEGI